MRGVLAAAFTASAFTAAVGCEEAQPAGIQPDDVGQDVQVVDGGPTADVLVDALSTQGIRPEDILVDVPDVATKGVRPGNDTETMEIDASEPRPGGITPEE
jgi:hypothetical protein